MYQNFKTTKAPETGRRAIQITEGDSFCYPLYYFIPSMSLDGRYLVYHCAEKNNLQLHRMDLETGESRRISQATSPKTRWVPWCVESGTGVMDHLSVLNVRRNEVIYFDGNNARCVSIHGEEDRLLFTIPEDRMPMGQNCVSADGKWFVYIHHDTNNFHEVYDGKGSNRHLSRGTKLAAYHLDTGEHRTLVVINSPIHHVLPYGNDHFVFCHPATENGMLLTDLEGGWYTHLRTQDENGWTVCHYVATCSGLAYELLKGASGQGSGLYDPFSHRKYEFSLPSTFGYTHTGADPEGLLWIYENQIRAREEPDTEKHVHDLWFLAAHVPDGKDEWIRLSGDWPTFGDGQKSHFHPRLTPDRNWILMTAGDPDTRTNHLFLIDVSDLPATRGIPKLIDKSD